MPKGPKEPNKLVDSLMRAEIKSLKSIHEDFLKTKELSELINLARQYGLINGLLYLLSMFDPDRHRHYAKMHEEQLDKVGILLTEKLSQVRKEKCKI